MNRERLKYCEKHNHPYGVKTGCVDCKFDEWNRQNDLLHDKEEILRQQKLEAYWKQTCIQCKITKAWYSFKILHNGARSTRCVICIEQEKNSEILLKKIRIRGRLDKLIYRAMKNTLPDLRDHLFETLTLVKDGKMGLDRAKSICDIAQVIINSAKVEIDFIKAVGSKRSEFLQPSEDSKLLNE